MSQYPRPPPREKGIFSTSNKSPENSLFIFGLDSNKILIARKYFSSSSDGGVAIQMKFTNDARNYKPSGWKNVSVSA